ncbi:hypothetical protein L1987_48832 [Smallanthus sonchifolius]|uniref:Uncharacterized protein n=1 Tax=Smallanthus sonchifolius TaxID=185202 RepID=A0ACB9FTM7_9ASTR|nr:hypothetical protein L1987_48832 [Smallanthus sonchifolius]
MGWGKIREFAIRPRELTTAKTREEEGDARKGRLAAVVPSSFERRTSRLAKAEVEWKWPAEEVVSGVEGSDKLVDGWCVVGYREGRERERKGSDHGATRRSMRWWCPTDEVAAMVAHCGGERSRTRTGLHPTCTAARVEANGDSGEGVSRIMRS